MTDFHVNYAALLTGLTLITGIVWLLDKLWLEPRRRRMLPPGTPDKPSSVVDFGRSFFPVIAFILVLRSFIAEPFRIPSGSMLPTLNIGDFILVNKFTYGLRDPVFHHKFLQVGEVKRGEIVVFKYPRDPRKDYIKRIVGVPGDRIVYRDKVLSINGEVASQDGGAVYTGPYGELHISKEQLGSVDHRIMVNPARSSDDFEFTVPAGEYFAMGDNRDGSEDSRYWGTVPEANLVGRAFFIWMSWDSANTRVDFSRIGTKLK